MHVTKDAADGHHFGEQGRVNLVTDAVLEGGKGIGIHVLKALALDLPEVDPPQPVALGTKTVQQVHVETVGGVGLTVQAGDEVESRQQFRQTTRPALAAVAVDQVHRGLELSRVAVQPVGFVNGGVCRFNAKGQHGAIAQRGHEGLRDLFRFLKVLGDDARVAVVGVQDTEPFVLAQTVEQAGNRFRIRTWILHLTDAVSEVGVGVRHPAKSNMTDPGIERKAHFCDDVVGRAPDRRALLRLDAKAAPALVPDAALVHLHLVGQRTGLLEVRVPKVWVVQHGLRRGAGMGP